MYLLKRYSILFLFFICISESLNICTTEYKTDIMLFRYNNLVLMDATYKTCKLAIPLFFLVVKTNVNYCVIGDFIIQTDDTESIREALKELSQHWEKHGVMVNAWMVDKQPAEQAALKTVFPDSEIYLCDFHNLQAWGRRFKMSKFGLSSHREEGMAVMRSVADLCTQEEFEHNLRALKSSHVWNKSRSTLPAYFEKEWIGNQEVNTLHFLGYYIEGFLMNL